MKACCAYGAVHLQVHWTSEVTKAIETGGSKGLAAYAEHCTLELNKIVNLVRGQLAALERATCGALVVIDVHARDVVVGMARDGVEDPRDFKWESQMRYYWEFNEQPPSGGCWAAYCRPRAMKERAFGAPHLVLAARTYIPGTGAQGVVNWTASLNSRGVQG